MLGEEDKIEEASTIGTTSNVDGRNNFLALHSIVEGDIVHSNIYIEGTNRRSSKSPFIK